MARITLVAALARNRVIGRRNQLPWRLPEDLRRFKALTMGHPVIMGRKTYESILAAIGRPLPGRLNIIVTRSPDYTAPGCIVAASLEAAIAAAEPAAEVFVIGGAEIYRAALASAHRLHLTEIGADFDGDAWFPGLPPGEWREVSRESHPPGPEFAHGYAFVVYERSPQISA
ncbi:MAG: dihydrofolate reductase [Betaproteobacteria bacterium]|jgi:dihydrofolate reductase|nr:dihydrofolate reductase [Betaproteobacteria bacterium]